MISVLDSNVDNKNNELYPKLRKHPTHLSKQKTN